MNYQFICKTKMSLITIDEACELANKNPCFSMVALVTYLYKKHQYPVPLNSELQQRLLNEITNHVQMEWDKVLDVELERFQEDCSQSDIDFEFVIDSSGSVGAANWQTTMSLIGEYWIKQIVRPTGSQTCGNHVAGRWFSSGSQRFHNFRPPPANRYAPKNYSDYVGDIFKNYPYNGGGTNTAGALQAVRTQDMKLTRGGLKEKAFHFIF